VLLVDTAAAPATAPVARLVEALRAAGHDARAALAHYPADGTSPQELFA
jgi:hypothetical protein